VSQVAASKKCCLAYVYRPADNFLDVLLIRITHISLLDVNEVNAGWIQDFVACLMFYCICISRYFWYALPKRVKWTKGSAKIAGLVIDGLDNKGLDIYGLDNEWRTDCNYTPRTIMSFVFLVETPNTNTVTLTLSLTLA